jgi:hypothetical protein
MAKKQKKLKKGTIVEWELSTGKIIKAIDIEGKLGYRIKERHSESIFEVLAEDICRVISKPAKKQVYEDRLATLADAYGIQPTSMVTSQITDLGADLSGERPEEAFKLLLAVLEDLKKLAEAYKWVPNVLMDSKLTNVLKSVQTLPFEYGAMFFIGADNAGIRWKREPQDFKFNIDALKASV